jgi:hypothetical protein
MNKTIGLFQKSVVLVSPLLLNSISLPEGIYSHSGFLESANATSIGSQIHFTEPQSRSGSGQPGGRGRGAGGRGPCKKDESLAALVPAKKTATREFVRGLTTVEHPTFWFYIPGQTAEVPIEFVLQDEGENDVYRTSLKVPQNSPGIVSVPVPATVAPLGVNKSYRWILAISCDPADVFSKMLVRGEIQRVGIPPEIQKSLDTAQTPLDKAILYANNGIWFDALTALGAQLQQSDRRDAAVSTAWADLLRQGHLEDLATAPILPCCAPTR